MDSALETTLATGAPAADATPAVPTPRRRRRALLWSALVLLLLVAQTLLVALTARYEASRAQDKAEALAAESAAEIRRELARVQQLLQALTWNDPTPQRWHADAADVLRQRRDLMRIERRDPALRVVDVVDSPYGPKPFTHIGRDQLDIDTQLACAAVRRSAAPTFSRSYFVPLGQGFGLEVIDLCLPVQEAGREQGFMVATFALGTLLESSLSPEQARSHELSFVEGDGTRLARAGAQRGTGVYVAERIVDLPGLTLQLRADSSSGRPQLIPNLATALVLGLSIALFGLVLALARDVRRRARAESALAEALAFRKAMEDSLITGLRARDLEGRITYVNPAFCAMVGFGADELRGVASPPYWPPELAGEYATRQRARLAGGAGASREGFETVFRRRDGERFPVMIYEAPLVDGHGRHTGWMSAVLDLSAQRRVEELSRQQQERLQATARLATVGEMASLMSHELNQPLSAIASYASGSLNLLDAPDRETPSLLRQALERIAEQAERAGRVIKSVHDFVRRREQARETIGSDQLIESVLPLVRLQARKSGTRIEVDLPPRAPRVVGDRTMLEQVLLNLTRNGIQAMEHDTPPARRVLRIAARRAAGPWVGFHVVDAGPGIAPEVASKLFTPFFTTRPEGMGLGLSLCRTVVEQHGGALEFESPAPGGGGSGCEFRFTVPAAADTGAAVAREGAA